MGKFYKFAAILAIAIFLFQASGLSCFAMEFSVIEKAACECVDSRTADTGSDEAGCQSDCQCPCNISLSFAKKTEFIQPWESRFHSTLTVPANLRMALTSIFQPPKPCL